MESNKLNLGEVLASVNNESDLDGNNVIEKIKSKLNEKNSVVYQKWAGSQFDINYSFTVKDSYPETKYNKVTLLYIATAIGATNLVKALLAVSEIDVDKKASWSDQFTPLQLAAMEGYKEIAELLIAKNADCNKGTYMDIILQCAIMKDDRETAKRVDCCINTPLYLAVENGHTGLVELLVKEKKCSKKNIKPLLDMADSKGYTEMVARMIRLFLDENVVDVIGGDRNNLLHYAADHCDEAVILALVNKNLDPWLKNRSGETPVDIYLSKRGSGYLMQLKKAKSKSTIVCYLTMALGAAVIVSLFATDKIAPGMIAPIIVTPWMLCIIGVVMFLLAFIAKHITYKVCKPSAETKEMHNLDITDTKKEMDDKEKSADPEKLARRRIFLVEEYGSSSQKDLQKSLNDLKDSTDSRKREKDNFSIELVDPTELGKKVTLEDVIVSDKVKEVAREICGHIDETTMELSQAFGCETPKGYIFHGEPGCGKTLLARAIAHEANAKFISISGPDFDKSLVGESASYIGALFKKARENAPCIIFIDEIDSVGKRGVDRGFGGVRARNDVINKLLAELDGLNPCKGVIVTAATNHLDYLDEALTRPGRLSEHIYIPLPEKEQRKKILDFYLKKDVDMKRVTIEVDSEELVEKTNGFSGASLKDLVNKAKRHAILRAKKGGINDNVQMTITTDDFNSAFSDLKKKKPQKSENGQVSSNKISNCTICNPVMQGFHLSHSYGAR